MEGLGLGFRVCIVVMKRGCTGLMEKNMETTIMGYVGYILGLLSYRNKGI